MALAQQTPAQKRKSSVRPATRSPLIHPNSVEVQIDNAGEDADVKELRSG